MRPLPLRLCLGLATFALFSSPALSVAAASSPATASAGGLPVTVTLTGSVDSPQGKPQAGAYVGFGGSEVITDNDGDYSLAVDLAKVVTGFVWAPGAQYEPLTLNLSGIAPGTPTVELSSVELASVFDPTYPAALNGLPITSSAGSRTVTISGWSKYGLDPSVFVTRPSGWAHTYRLHLSGRNYSASIPFGPSGSYDVELLASDGLELFNIPVFHGVRPTPPVGPTVAADPAGASEPTLAHFALDLINHLRTERDLAPFSMDKNLRAAALAHSQDMAVHGYYYDHPHIGSNGSTLMGRIHDTGAYCAQAAENVSLAPTVGGAYVELVQSPAHLLAFEERYSRVGIGLARWQGNWLMVVDLCK